MAKSKLKWTYIAVVVVLFIGLLVYLSRPRFIEDFGRGAKGSKVSSSVNNLRKGKSCTYDTNCQSKKCKKGICT